MKKITKATLIGFGLLVSAGVLSSCTASFCSKQDTAKILYTMERGVTTYHESAPSESSTEQVTKAGLTFYTESSINNSKLLRNTIVPTLLTNKYFVPSIEFYELVDEWVLDTALAAWEVEMTNKGEEPILTSVGTISIPQYLYDENGNQVFDENGKEVISHYTTNYDQNTLYGVLNRYGHLKFYTPNIEGEPEIELFTSLKKQIEIWRQDPALTSIMPGNDYINYYTSTLTSTMANIRSCVYTVGEDGDVFGMYGDPELNDFYEQVEITRKDWGYAWSKGLFEGLLIYPIAYVVDSLTTIFAGGNAGLISGNGWAQVGAILLVTIILRTLIMLISLKTTLGQAKMQKLQPQIAKLQEKYPNSNTNQYEKQRLAQEQMALYKKNKVSPFGSIIVMIVQFPIFICVWGALSGSSALSTGTFYNMNLSQTVWEALNNTAGLPGNVNGWWTAFILIFLMTICQIAATITPMLIQRKQRKEVEKTGKNPAANKQNRTMKIVQFVMLAMIIFMGFTLPSAMGVYWIAGAIFSLGQTLIMNAITSKKGNKKGTKTPKKAKKEENINDKVVLEATPIEAIPAEKPVKNNKPKKNNYKEFKYPKKRGGRQ